MLRKKIFVFIVLCTFLLFLTGCNFFNQKVITLNLAAFPITQTTYDITVIAYKNHEAVGTFIFNDVAPNSRLNRIVTIKGDTETVMIFLTKKYESEPAYFTGFNPGTRDTYNIGFWVDYYKYVNFDIVDYGVSEYFLQEVGLGSSIELDFSDAPYFIFKVPNVQNKDIIVKYSDESNVKVGYYAEVPLEASWGINDGADHLLANWSNGDLYLIAKPYSYTADPQPIGTLSIREENIDLISWDISQALSGDTPNRVFAVGGGDKIFVIDPIQKSLIKTITTEILSPSGLAYSAIDKKMYLGSPVEGSTLECLNVETGDSTILTINDIDISGIAVSPSARKLYVVGSSFYTTTSWLNVVDMDTNQVLNKAEFVQGGSVYFSEITKKLYSTRWDYSAQTYTLYRYSMENDIPTLEEEKVISTSIAQVQFTADGSKVFYTHKIGNSTSVVVLDALSFYNVLGQWDAGAELSSFTFSPEGSIVYAIHFAESDEYIHVVDMNNFTEVRKIAYPRANDGGMIAANSDGSVILGMDHGNLFYISTATTAATNDVANYTVLTRQEIKELGEYIKKSSNSLR